MRTIRDYFIIVGIALAFVFCIAGCGRQDVYVHHDKQEINVHHDPQELHLHKAWRERRRHSQP